MSYITLLWAFMSHQTTATTHPFNGPSFGNKNPDELVPEKNIHSLILFLHVLSAHHSLSTSCIA